MIRDEFNLFWNSCTLGETGYIPGPGIIPLPISTWLAYKNFGIIDGYYVPSKFIQPLSRLLPLSGREWKYNEETDEFTVAGLSSTELMEDYYIGMTKDEILSEEANKYWVNPDIYSGWILTSGRSPGPSRVLHVVHRDKLASLIAQHWGFSYRYRKIVPDGYQVGTFGQNIPIVILSKVNEHRTSQALEIANILGPSEVIIINTHGIQLTQPETERLNSKGINYLNTIELLTYFGQPRWELIKVDEFFRGSDEFKYSSGFTYIVWQGKQYE
jgi:hypothetical protein